MNASFNVFAYRGPWMELSWRTCALLTAFTLVFAGFPLSFASADTILSDGFGTGSSSNEIADWEEEGEDSNSHALAQQASGSGEDSASPDGDRFAKIGDGEWICRQVDATSYENLELGYYWRDDSSAEDNEYGVVEYFTTGTCDSPTDLTTVASHELDDGNNGGSVWSSLSTTTLPISLNDTAFYLRFRNTANSSDEHFRVDGVYVTADQIVEEPATLTVTKVVTNDNGGTAVVGEFALSVGAESVTSGVSEEFEAGEYSITEDGPEGYSATFTGDCDEDGNIEMDAGGTYECTITNDDQPAELTIVKHTVGGDGSFDFTVGNGTATTSVSDLETTGNEATSTVMELNAGTYSVTETQQSGWNFTSSYCTYEGSSIGVTIENGEQITVDVGDEVVCTFTNTELGSFSLTKNSHTDELAEDATLEGPGDFTDTESMIGAGGIEVWDEHSGDLEPGEYTVTAAEETISCGDNGTGIGSVTFDVSAGESVTCFINNSDYGIIAGQKFEDMNADGNSEGDSGLSGWEVIATRLDDDSNTTEIDESVTNPIYPGITDEDGNYSIIVPPGEYRVCETAQGGWYQTYPFEESGSETLIPTDNCAGAAWGWTFTVTSGTSEEGVVAGVSFGNYQLGTVSGTKWNDADADGEWDESETGVEGITVYVDYNDNEISDPGEPEATTAGDGTYTIEDVEPGTWQVKELAGSGWVAMYPEAGYHEIELSSGEAIENIDFGNTEDATISGTKWIDENGNGEWDEGEDPASADEFTFDLYMQDPENTETPIYIGSTTNNGDGEYMFEGLLPGEYFVQEVAQAGWVLTYPSPAQGHEVELSVNEDAVDVDFGNMKVATVSGAKFNDMNNNGSRDMEIDPVCVPVGDVCVTVSSDTQEPGISGWTIVATPVIAEGEEETDERVEKTTTTDVDGNYFFSFTNDELGDWIISEQQQNGWFQTYPTEPTYYEVEIEDANDEFEDLDFGNWQEPTTSSSTIDVYEENLVSATSSMGWLFYNDETDTIDNSLGSFVEGPGTAPLGDGSVQITSSGTQRRNLATYQFAGTRLDSLSALKFSTYNASTTDGAGENSDRSGYLQFNVSFDGNDTWQRRLVYVPAANSAEPIEQGVWKEWDAINDGNALWSWSGYFANGSMWTDGETDEYRTWSEIIAAFPDAQIRSSDSFLGIRVGEPYADGYTENLDKFVIATSTGSSIAVTTYNFEPGSAPEPEPEPETPPTNTGGTGGGSNGPIAGSIPTGGGGGGAGSPTTPGDAGTGSGTGSGGGTSGGGTNGPVNNGGVFDGTFADAGGGVGGDASGAGSGGAGTEDGGTPTGGEETPTGTGEQEEGNGQVAAAAAAVGDFLTQYWWLILLLILLLGGGYWAWREYFQRAN